MEHALVAGVAGERIIVRWELRDLLHEPDELFPAVLEDASVTG